MAKRNKIKPSPILEETFVEESKDSTSIKEQSQQQGNKEAKTSESIFKKLNSAYQTIKQDTLYNIFTGFILILLSVFCIIAFTSFFFTWHEDFDKVTSSFSVLFNYETEVENWLGKFGALISYVFIYKFFGVASYAIAVSLLIWGIKKVRLQQTAFNLLLHTLFWMIWISLTASFFLQEKYPFAGGGYGEVMNTTFTSIIGKWGLLTFLIVSLATYFFINPVLIRILSNIFTSNKIHSDTQNSSTSITDVENIPFSDEIKTDSIESEEDEEDIEIEVVQNEEKKSDEPQPSTTEEVQEVVFQINNEEQNKPKQEDKNNEPKFTIEQPATEPIAEPEREPTPEDLAKKLVEEQGEFNPRLDLSEYQFPSIDLLNDYGSGTAKINQEELIQNKDKIIKTLKNYGIDIQEIKATVGPTVTLYEIIPAPGVRIARIKNLEDDIALSLAALGIRIIAPMPGKGTIGIEVPNQNPEVVSMKSLLAADKFQNSNYDLPVILGKTISNEVYIADLTKMPHLLMAGATGQGKSVGLNVILASLLYKKHPAEIKFVLVDPKKVELTLFNKVERHFLAKLPNSEDAIITDTKKVIHTLNSLCIEMDNRYALLQDAQVRNIKEYNQKFTHRKLNPNDGHHYLPYIVVVIDEFADLIMTAGKEVEEPIARIAQLARAVGIHLIIATQRPSVNIITGVIKANFPARVAFRVSSKIDSRTILDIGGAEQLIGKGDMLYNAGSELVRVQCPFIDTPEVERVTEFIGIQRAYPTAFLLPEYHDENEDSGGGDIDLSERDKLFEEAAKIVVQFNQGSVSFLQRKLKIGFNRAGRLVDQLEAAGIVGPFEGSKTREVLIKDMQQLSDILNNLSK